MEKYNAKYEKVAYDSSKHYPNANEAKLLRKLMAEKGLTEEEIRESKVYRKMLAEARAKKGNKTEEERLFLTALKEITRKLKLPKEHPDVIEALKKYIIETRYYSKNILNKNGFIKKYIYNIK